MDLLTTPVLAPLVGSAAVARTAVALCGVIVVGSMWGVALWACPIRGATGVDCPGCGLTRSIALLLRGEWAESVRAHLFGPAALAAGALLVWSAVLTTSARRKLELTVEKVERATAVIPLGLIGMLLYWLLRLV